MMTKNKTSIKYSGVYLLVIPLICVLLFAFSGNNYKTVLNKSNQSLTIVTDNDPPSIYPVDIKKVSKINGYGDWINPITKEKDFHYGIDLALPEGEKVMSTADGVVIEAKFDTEKKKGNYILIKHNKIYSTFYSHLKSIAVKAGDRITKGQIIGYVGNTGLSTGPHLHYEVIKNGERVNPKDYLPK